MQYSHSTDIYIITYLTEITEATIAGEFDIDGRH